MTTKIILAIDAPSRIYRFFFATRGHVSKTLEQYTFEIDAIAQQFGVAPHVCFDCSGLTWRHELYPQYKSGRKERPRELEECLRSCKEIGAKYWTVMEKSRYEADDLVATITQRSVDAGCRVVILSSDKDARQLLSDGKVVIAQHCRRKGIHCEIDWFNTARLRADHGVSPDRWVEWQAVVGQPTDALPGADGIGEQTASRMLATHSLQEWFADPLMDGLLNSKQMNGLAAFKPISELMIKLCTLDRNITKDKDEQKA